VPEVGLEPTRGCPHRILSPAQARYSTVPDDNGRQRYPLTMQNTRYPTNPSMFAE
jgi:hypothetical protein